MQSQDRTLFARNLISEKTEAYRRRLVDVDASGRYTGSVCTMAESHGKAGYNNPTTNAGTGRRNKLG